MSWALVCFDTHEMAERALDAAGLLAGLLQQGPELQRFLSVQGQCSDERSYISPGPALPVQGDHPLRHVRQPLVEREQAEIVAGQGARCHLEQDRSAVEAAPEDVKLLLGKFPATPGRLAITFWCRSQSPEAAQAGAAGDDWYSAYNGAAANSFTMRISSEASLTARSRSPVGSSRRPSTCSYGRGWTRQDTTRWCALSTCTATFGPTRGP